MALTLEQPKNGVSTTLASAISSTSATSCSLTSATGWTNAQYHCLLYDPNANVFEVVLATALSGTTLTIVRSVETFGGSSTAHTFAISPIAATTIVNITSVSLTAGTWLVVGRAYLHLTTATLGHGDLRDQRARTHADLTS